MGYRSAMGNQMKALIGLREQPMGSNHAPPVTTWYGLGNAAWCDEAISYAAAHSDNLATVGGKFAYTVAHAARFKAMGRWHYGTSGIRPGDIVFFQWEGGTKSISRIDHVGWVYWVHNGSVYTVEGNRGDVCKRMKYPLGSAYITGYGRPAFKAEGGKPAPAKPKVSAPKYPGTILKVKSPYITGHGTAYVQAELNRRGYSPKLAVDRVYGPKTAAQVKKYQKQHKLTVDGEVGPKTWASMFGKS